MCFSSSVSKKKNQPYKILSFSLVSFSLHCYRSNVVVCKKKMGVANVPVRNAFKHGCKD